MRWQPLGGWDVRAQLRHRLGAGQAIPAASMCPWSMQVISYLHCTGAARCLGWGLGAHLKMKVMTKVMTKVTKVTTTSRSAVTNLMGNLGITTQSMSTTQMTQTDADAHSLLSTCKCVRIRVGVKVLG